MKMQLRNIIALVVLLIPFYFVAILQKILFTQEQIFVDEYLGYYMLLGIVGISTVIIVYKFLLKKKLTVFRASDSKIIIEFALAGIILSIIYALKSIEVISYGKWFSNVINDPVPGELLSKIFDSTLYSILFIGPFIWINEAFAALSVGFILLTFWHFSDKKIWVWCSIILTASIFATIQINLGIPDMITSFIVIATAACIFYKYRSILPLFFASIIHQTIELANYWYYS